MDIERQHQPPGQGEARNALVFGTEAPSVNGIEDLMRQIDAAARSAVERRKGEIAEQVRRDVRDELQVGLGSTREEEATIQQRTAEALLSVNSLLLKAWEAFKDSAAPYKPQLWPLDLCGLDSTLDGWRSDLKAWRLEQALKESLPWVERLLAWHKAPGSESEPSIPIPSPNLALIKNWEEETTWLCLVSAPGLVPPAAPAIIQWQSLEAAMSGEIRRLKSPAGTRIAEQVELLWSPDDPEERQNLLDMANLHRATYLAEPI
jgi:hypothetical protein